MNDADTVPLDDVTALGLLALVSRESRPSVELSLHADVMAVRVLCLAVTMLPAREAVPSASQLRPAFLSADVIIALYYAVVRLHLAPSMPAADLIARRAQRLLADHLDECYLAVPPTRGGVWTLDDWLSCAPAHTIAEEMQCAAFCAYERAVSVTGLPSALHTWTGAVTAYNAHPIRKVAY